MQLSLVMTVIGQDRPGLVESIARVVAEHGGNWLESRMSRLGGQFAGIVRVQLPREHEVGAVRALKALEAEGLTVVVHSDQPAAPQGDRLLRVLDLVGQDRPGIVREISHALASFGVNVEELHTEISSAAMSGETLFQARATVSIPPACDLASLRVKLEQIAADLIVDVSLGEAPMGAAGHRTAA
jgi:glycine cleavage system regulatory protein